MHQIHFLLGELTVPPDPCLYIKGLLLRGWRETGDGKKVKGKEGERWREGFGPPKILVWRPYDVFRGGGGFIIVLRRL